MNVRNSLLLVVGITTLLSSACVVSAQTTTTTPLETATQNNSDQTQKFLEAKIDALAQDRLKLIQTPAEIRAGAIRDYLNIETNPLNPGPNQDITVRAESYLSDLNKAVITWSVNGRPFTKGIGKTTFKFSNGGPGETTKLGIAIVTNEGQNITKELVFNPVGVTILWEADTYTPPFYRGKALVSPQAEIRAVAVPDITNAKNALDAGNLVYVWQKDGSNVPELSGYGKNTFTFTGAKPYSKSDIRVRVSSLTDTIASEMRLSIPLVSPFILFYENHPLLGVWYNRPIGKDLKLNHKELSLSAEPFFFSNSSPEQNDFRYTWTVNGSKIPNSGRIITFQNEKGTAGTSQISFAIQGLEKTFQAASRSASLTFTENSSQQEQF